jgi:hypothetical protein
MGKTYSSKTGDENRYKTLTGNIVKGHLAEIGADGITA